MIIEWPSLPIGDICTIYDGPHATPKKTIEGPIFLGISNLSQGRLDLSNVEHLSEEDFARWTRRVAPQAGDVVFSYETRLGEVALIPEGLRCCLGRRMGLLRPDTSKVDSRFLLYAYLGPQFQQVLHARTIHGSTVNRIPLIDLPSFPIQIPSLPIQRRIADILGALDDKIDVNRRIVATLEAMAQALFQHWFVDFGPFQDGAFVETELGPVPERWVLRSLYDCAEYINGAAYRDFDFSSDRSGLPIIKIVEIKNGITLQTKFTNKNMGKKYHIRDGEMLFSWSGSPETSIDTFLWSGGDGWLNQHIFRVLPKREEERAFVYFLLRSLRKEFIEIARNKQTTGLGHVTVKDLRRMKTAIPPSEIMRSFYQVADPIYQQILQCQLETRALAATRDYLLPKLLSGEVSVEVAEESVAEVL